MARPKNDNRRPKIQVQVSEELDQKIIETSKEIGMSKSAFCAFIIGDYFIQRKQVQEGIQEMVQSLAKQDKKL